MAIKRYLGDHFFGLSSDTKPTDVDDGATFDESDTGSQYHKVNNAWVALSVAGGTGDWTFGVGTQTNPGSASITPVGTFTLATSASNSDVIIDPHGTGGLRLNKPSSGAFNIKTNETGGSGTGLVTIFPEDGSITYGGGISLYAYAHASKPGMTWIGYGGSLGVSIGLGSDAVLGTSRLDIDGTSVRTPLTTAATSTTTGALRSAGGLGVVGSAYIGGSLTVTGEINRVVSWTEVTGTSQSMAVTKGYIANNAGLVTLTLPDTAAVGSIVAVVGQGAGGWKIAQNASEVIHFGSVNTTTGTGGSLASTNRYDCVELICTVANTEWVERNSVGTITIV